MCLRRSCTQSTSLQQNTEAVGSWELPEHHPGPDTQNHRSTILNSALTKGDCPLTGDTDTGHARLFYQALPAWLLPQASGQALCSRTQASPQGLRAMKELSHHVTHCFSNSLRGQSHSGQGWPVRKTRPGNSSPNHVLTLLQLGAHPNLSGNAEDFLAQSADRLLTSGPEIPSKDLMHQGSSLRLPIQPKRKPQP